MVTYSVIVLSHLTVGCGKILSTTSGHIITNPGMRSSDDTARQPSMHRVTGFGTRAECVRGFLGINSLPVYTYNLDREFKIMWQRTLLCGIC